MEDWEHFRRSAAADPSPRRSHDPRRLWHSPVRNPRHADRYAPSDRHRPSFFWSPAGRHEAAASPRAPRTRHHFRV